MSVLLRKNTNPRALDIAPQLQNTLNANGMQAQIAMTSTGEYQLVTMSHNTSTPRRYTLNEAQLEALRNGGTNVSNKKAYQTFVSIVKNDYYIPGSWVAARNANSPVNMGLNGHRLNPGEYGYQGERPFRPFEGARFGRFDSFLDGFRAFGRHGYHARRIDDRPFFASSAPVVMDRPDGRLKPGELKTGDYGFYDKGTQQQDSLANMKVDAKPKVLVRPKGQALTLGEYLNNYSAELTFSGDGFNKVLSSHGIVIDKDKKTLTIKSDGVNKNFQYSLTDEELKKILNDKLRFTSGEGKHKMVHNKTAPNISERLDVINNVISRDFSEKITKEHLQSKDYINIKLKPEVEQELNLGQQQATSYAKSLDAIDIDMKKMRQDYKTGYIDKWNSIGVVDGRSLDASQGFYLPVKDGRAVSVGEIQAYPTNDGQKTSFRMTAVINNQLMSHEISRDDYLKFINYDDEYRLKLFDKVFDEVKIKSASHGQMQDSVRSRGLEQADGVVTMKGDYSLVNEKTSAVITGAMAWKDQISGNYQINVRTNKDVGMWSFKITEAQYNAFKNGTDHDRANLLTTLIPFTDENRQAMKVVESNSLYQGGYTRGQNANITPTLAKVLKDMEAAGIGYEIVNKPNISEQERFDAIKTGLQKLQNFAKTNGNDYKIPSDAEIWQMLKESPDPRKQNSVEKGTVHYGNETINLNDLRNAAKINLMGDAGVNGESLNNVKESKEWKRSGDHGRATTVGDISVERLKDEQGKVIEGKYKMSAVIDGNVISHEITQKDFNKFLAVNDYQRMKLFDKIFPEVEMKTKPGHGFNLGAAILAAVTTGLDVAASLSMSAPPRPKPDFYESRAVFSKPGVVSPEAVAAASYAAEIGEDRGHGEGRGMGV